MRFHFSNIPFFQRLEVWKNLVLANNYDCCLLIEKEKRINLQDCTSSKCLVPHAKEPTFGRFYAFGMVRTWVRFAMHINRMNYEARLYICYMHSMCFIIVFSSSSPPTEELFISDRGLPFFERYPSLDLPKSAIFKLYVAASPLKKSKCWRHPTVHVLPDLNERWVL